VSDSGPRECCLLSTNPPLLLYHACPSKGRANVQSFETTTTRLAMSTGEDDRTVITLRQRSIVNRIDVLQWPASQHTLHVGHSVLCRRWPRSIANAGYDELLLLLPLTSDNKTLVIIPVYGCRPNTKVSHILNNHERLKTVQTKVTS
jgi:hypothetical protein